jgi:hypothetical protein
MRLTIVCCACVIAACGKDPVSVSSPVGIELKAKSGDVTGAAVSEQKDITTESGNPYGAFVADAQRKLGTVQASQIEIDGLTLVLGGTSTNVSALEQVFTGDVDVAFVINDSNNTYDVAHITNPAGVGPAGMSVNFNSGTLAPQDTAKFVGGGFKVVIRGTAATGFAGKGAEANLQLTFTFVAFE